MVVQGVESGVPGVHIDTHTDDLDAEVQRLIGLRRRWSSRGPTNRKHWS